MDALYWLEKFAEKEEEERRKAFNKMPQHARDELCKALAAIAANYAVHAGGFNAEFNGTVGTVAGVDADLVFEYCRERLRQSPLTMASGVNAPLAGFSARSDGEEIRVEVHGRICGVARIYFDENNIVAIDASPCANNSQATHTQQTQTQTETPNDTRHARLNPTVGDELEIELE